MYAQYYKIPLRISNSHHYLHFSRGKLNRSNLFMYKTVTKVYPCMKPCPQFWYKAQEEKSYQGVYEAINLKGYCHINRKTSHRDAVFVDFECSKNMSLPARQTGIHGSASLSLSFPISQREVSPYSQSAPRMM